MADILYLVHRLPYPPNKGDKVRSWHLLRQLAERHRVHLGTFIDDPDDEQHLPVLQRVCASVHVQRIQPRLARVASLRGLLTGEALTLPYYRNAALARWVRGLQAGGGVDAAVVFSAAMVPYTDGMDPARVLVDFVDMDSAKWTEYAPNHAWPLSWLYRREGQRLLAYERRVAARVHRSLFATDKEAALFCRAAPEAAARVKAVSNGVDAEYFTPDPARASPFRDTETPLVFTGAMDYWPNVDAVCWFAAEVLPLLRRAWPQLRLHIVGRSPTPAVQALAGEGVVVTGTVPDVRPYLQHAAVVVAPLRLARGVQNKILEAMAMGRPVVAAESCVQALFATPGVEIASAASADAYLEHVLRLLQLPDEAESMGAAGRQRVLAAYDWRAHLSEVDRQLDAMLRVPAARPGTQAVAGARSLT